MLDFSRIPPIQLAGADSAVLGFPHTATWQLAKTDRVLPFFQASAERFMVLSASQPSQTILDRAKQFGLQYSIPLNVTPQRRDESLRLSQVVFQLETLTRENGIDWEETVAEFQCALTEWIADRVKDKKSIAFTASNSQDTTTEPSAERTMTQQAQNHAIDKPPITSGETSKKKWLARPPKEYLVRRRAAVEKLAGLTTEEIAENLGHHDFKGTSVATVNRDLKFLGMVTPRKKKSKSGKKLIK